MNLVSKMGSILSNGAGLRRVLKIKILENLDRKGTLVISSGYGWSVGGRCSIFLSLPGLV